MTDGLDMSEHITHREFQDAIAPLATKRELEIWSGALIGRMDAQFETLQLHMDAMQRNMEAMRRDLQRDMDAMRSELQSTSRATPARASSRRRR
jgi:Skp family chaperone for outer membrane proteins